MPVICTADNSSHKTPEALRVHLRKWLKANPELGKVWAVDYLVKRKEEKGLVHAPSQAELRTLYCPTMPYYDSIGGYYEITQSLGFKARYIKEPLFFTPWMKDTVVICDTREQTPFNLPIKTIREGLKYGDYALAAPYSKGIHIERKSIEDFRSSLSGKKIKHKRIEEDSPQERFERELIRAKEANGYIVMLVEDSIQTVSDYCSQTKFGKATASHIFKNMRDLLVKYPDVWQIVFANGREDAAQKVTKIFELGEQVKRVDLQYALEKGEL
jgi:hypothetical protein